MKQKFKAPDHVKLKYNQSYLKVYENIYWQGGGHLNINSHVTGYNITMKLCFHNQITQEREINLNMFESNFYTYFFENDN